MPELDLLDHCYPTSFISNNLIRFPHSYEPCQMILGYFVQKVRRVHAWFFCIRFCPNLTASLIGHLSLNPSKCNVLYSLLYTDLLLRQSSAIFTWRSKPKSCVVQWTPRPTWTVPVLQTKQHCLSRVWDESLAGLWCQWGSCTFVTAQECHPWRHTCHDLQFHEAVSMISLLTVSSIADSISSGVTLLPL